MKISLKTTILIICVAVIGVIAYQFYWLNSLYSTSKEKLEVNIRSAMRSADLEELQLRIKTLEADPDKTGEISASVGFSKKNESVLESKTSMTVTDSSGVAKDASSTFRDTTLLNKDTVPKQEDPNSLGAEMFKNGMFESMLIKGLHQSIDLIIFPNVQNFDSLLTIELSAYKIDKKHYVNLIEMHSDSVIATSSVDSTLIYNSKMKRFDYLFGMNDEYKYCLWIENPNSTVLKQMTGILTASFIVLFLLGWLFYYLMHTIWRQKTLEEMKNDFINNMTHEFKTPLSVSYAAIDSLLVTEKANNKEHRDKYLNIAKDQINHLSGLAEQILSMSRDSKRNVEMHPEKIELREMVESIVRQQSLAAKKQIKFDILIEPENLILNFDRMHLANILNNLIENSIKYSNESVEINIKSFFVNGKNIQISIEDNGIGIDSERQKNIFDKFYRVPTGDKHNVKGYGLGLFYVKETLERVGGCVYVKSKYGKGSIFTIHIPQ